MARAIADIENDIRSLSLDEKRELLRVLIAEIDVSLDPEIEALAKEFIARVARTGETLDAAIARLEHFDEEIARGRDEAREAVLRSGEQWPFALPQTPPAQ